MSGQISGCSSLRGSKREGLLLLIPLGQIMRGGGKGDNDYFWKSLKCERGMKGWGSYIKQQITTCSPSLYLLYSAFFSWKIKVRKINPIILWNCHFASSCRDPRCRGSARVIPMLKKGMKDYFICWRALEGGKRGRNEIKSIKNLKVYITLF